MKTLPCVSKNRRDILRLLRFETFRGTRADIDIGFHHKAKQFQGAWLFTVSGASKHGILKGWKWKILLMATRNPAITSWGCVVYCRICCVFFCIPGGAGVLPVNSITDIHPKNGSEEFWWCFLFSVIIMFKVKDLISCCGWLLLATARWFNSRLEATKVT